MKKKTDLYQYLPNIMIYAQLAVHIFVTLTVTMLWSAKQACPRRAVLSIIMYSDLLFVTVTTFAHNDCNVPLFDTVA